MAILPVSYFFLGLVLLIAGAEVLVKGAVRVASRAGISPLVIGLTVVAFATSSPEMAVCIHSALAGKGDIAVGNVVGSNILNILLILGLSATIMPLLVSKQLVRFDLPVMILSSFLMLIFALDGKMVRWEGALLFAGIVIYTLYTIGKSRRERTRRKKSGEAAPFPEGKEAGQSLYLHVFLVALGLGLLVGGSHFMIRSASEIARSLGVSELVIALTIIAAGTSLPEAATSIVATIRGERDIAVGNAVGSNIFNILGALALTAIVAPSGVTVSAKALHFDIPAMVAVALACLPIFFTGYTIDRKEGLLFLGYYCAYSGYLYLTSSASPILPFFNGSMSIFVIPVTVIILITVAIREFLAVRKKG